MRAAAAACGRISASLFGTAAFSASQGWSLALSADGNTALVGGPNDNGNVGAAWVFTRSNGTWSQQGSKLVSSDYSGTPEQGYSVGLSADGNTAIVGGYEDNQFVGAAWIYTRSNGTWTQQGSKLIGSGSVGSIVEQGWSVGLSSDGNTAIVGAPNDNSLIGAAWIYTRSAGVWNQQGSKLVGTGYVNNPQFFIQQGSAVAIAGNGNTAIVGGYGDNTGIGAAWVFTNNGGTWSQLGSKLVGSGYVGEAYQGT